MLPKIDVPTYTLKLPSNGKEVEVRPFLVKEEKLLLMAVKTDDTQEIIKATKQVLNNCIITPNIDVETLPFYDVDYLFIALRAKSIGETIKINFICLNKNKEGEECKGKFPVDLDISNIEVYKPEKDMKIKFNDNLIFEMKHPSYSVIKTLSDKEDVFENTIRLISACIDKIFSKDQYYTTKDFTPEELQTFIENLTQEQFERLEKFIRSFPTFSIKAEGRCLKCDSDHVVRYNDFVNFFR